jgi:hypothetical protein
MTKEEELELKLGSVIEQIGEAYGKRDPTEDEELLGKLGDLKLRRELLSLIRTIITLRKVTERYRDDGLQRVAYELLVHIECDVFEFKLSHRANWPMM